MRTVNIHEAKTHLSRLIEQALQGEPFIIAKVTAIDAPAETAVHRTGFLTGQISVPDDFDQIASDEIAQLFDGAQ